MVSLVAYLDLGSARARRCPLVVAVTGLGSSVATGRLADTVGPRRLVTVGLAVVTIGLAWVRT